MLQRVSPTQCSEAEEEIVRVVKAITPHFGLAFDFDDTLVCSEFVAAGVTAALVNPILKKAQFPALTAEHICHDYSGKSFAKQVDLIKEEYGIDIPPEVISQKRVANLEALARDTRVIRGSEEMLSLVRAFRLNAMVLTASEPDRVAVSAKCAGHDRHFLLTEKLEDDDRIPVISNGVDFEWQGKHQPALAAKPSPEGYIWVAKALGIPPKQMMGFEDSKTGIQALTAADYGRTGIVSMSRRCDLVKRHAEELRPFVHTGRSVIVRESWHPAMMAAFSMGLKAARAQGVKGLPQRLTPDFSSWLGERLIPAKAFG